MYKEIIMQIFRPRNSHKTKYDPYVFYILFEAVSLSLHE